MSGMDERPAQHPGETEPGPPGGERYMCPLCDWYLDVPAFDIERARVPRGAVLTSIDDVVRAVVATEHAEIEAALREHLTTEHTAPIVMEKKP